MLIHRLLREDSLCQGGEDQQRACQQANHVRCVSCGHDWEAEDTNFIGPCPSCGETGATIDRCEHCPVLSLEHARANTAAGRLLERTLDLDFDTKHFTIDWSEITCEAVESLKILAQERSKHAKELADELAQEQQQQKLMNQIQQRQNGGR